MSLKIAFVTGEYPPMEGGVGAFTQELGRALAGLGHEIHVITSYRARPRPQLPAGQEEQPDSETRLGEAWRRILDIREPVPIDIGYLHPRGRRWRWADMNMIADLTERFGFDVVNIQFQAAAFNMRSPAIYLLPWRLGRMTTTVVTYHDLRIPYLFPKAGRLRPWLVHRLARDGRGAIVTNRPDFEALTAAAPETPIRRIPIGSNIPVHKPNHIELQEARKSIGVDRDEKSVVIGYFGFLNQSKGADLLVEALTGLPKNVHVVFIGGRLGSSDSANNQLFLNRIQQIIDAYQLKTRVHWTGYLSHMRVSAFFRICDLIVLPYRDGVSLRRGTLMAALAHGRPIISTTPAGPIPELVHGENIWLVKQGDAGEIRAAVRSLLADPETRGRLASAARETSRQFSWDQIAAETASFFGELTANS